MYIATFFFLLNLQMELSKEKIAQLKQKGVHVFASSSRCMLLKDINAEGNFIPNWTSIPCVIKINERGETEEMISNCPILYVWNYEDKFELVCWNWVPGPGPGDFALEFFTEEDLFAFILSYFFGENEYFEARRKYEMNK